jgi:hypothetical protein
LWRDLWCLCSMRGMTLATVATLHNYFRRRTATTRRQQEPQQTNNDNNSNLTTLPASVPPLPSSPLSCFAFPKMRRGARPSTKPSATAASGPSHSRRGGTTAAAATARCATRAVGCARRQSACSSSQPSRPKPSLTRSSWCVSCVCGECVVAPQGCLCQKPEGVRAHLCMSVAKPTRHIVI